MTNFVHKQVLNSLVEIIRPIVQFLISAGVSYREFSSLCKVEYVRIASESFGLRGRPTNISRIAAITGLTRKEVKALRDSSANRIDSLVESRSSNAPTLILHYWHTDPEFSDPEGKPIGLEYDSSQKSFVNLCKRYAGDIPAGALRAELIRAGAITEAVNGELRAVRRFYTPSSFDNAFVKSMSFSLANLTSTLIHNAQFSQESDGTKLRDFGNLERYVWSADLSDKEILEFRAFSEARVESLLTELDQWIGDREQMSLGDSNEQGRKRIIGIGAYYFENSRQP